jgi:hypothetical protein
MSGGNHTSWGPSYGNYTTIGVSGMAHILLRDASGTRMGGRFSSFSEAGLRDWDLRLDYYDAANEDADGLLPHQRAALERAAEAEAARTAEVVAPVTAIRATRRWKRWDRPAILAAILAWHREHGRAPTAREWDKRTSTRWPTANTVADHFTTWNAAIEAAGLQPRRRGARKVAA